MVDVAALDFRELNAWEKRQISGGNFWAKLGSIGGGLALTAAGAFVAGFKWGFEVAGPWIDENLF